MDEVMKVYEGLYWVMDHRAHLRKIVLISLDPDGESGYVTTDNGRTRDIFFHSPDELIQELIRVLEA